MSAHRYGPLDLARDTLTRAWPNGPATAARVAAWYRREAPGLLGWALAVGITRAYVNGVPDPWSFLAFLPWTVYLLTVIRRYGTDNPAHYCLDENGDVQHRPDCPGCDHPDHNDTQTKGTP